MKIGELFIELGLKDADFGKGMRDAEKGVQQLQKAGTQMAQVLERTVVRGFQAATVAVAAFGAATVKVGAEFEQAITQVGAIAGATEAGFASLEGKARQLGATTMFSATEAATAMQDLARAGLSVNEILDASGPALLLAGSAGADMGQATKITAATLAQFGLQASDAGRISDVFSTALRKSLFDMESLTEAMKYAGTVGAGFGYSLEQTTAAVAMFRNLGLEGSMAGTNLRMALAAAAKPTASAEAALHRLGLTVQDINPELHTFDEIMQAIGSAGISTADAITVFGKRAGANVAQIARQFANGQTEFHDLLAALEDSAGSTEQLYGQMTNTVFAQSKIVLSALQELMLGTFDTFRGPLRDLLTELSETIAYVAQVFTRSSGQIAGGFEASLQGVTSWLRENREALAVAFVRAVEGVQQLGSTLAALLPHLRSAAELLVAMFAAQKVASFVVAVRAFFATSTTGLLTLQAQIRAVTAQLIASTGGIYAIVAAVGTLVAVLVGLSAANADAAAATERLRAAEAAMQKERDARAAREKARAAALHGEQQATLAGFQVQLQASGKLTHALERQLDALAKLSDEQIAAGLAAGDLFTATVDGTEVVLDAATALELRNEVLAEGAAAQRGETLAINRSREAQASLQRQLEDVRGALEARDEALARGTREAQADAIVVGKYGDSVEQAKLREQELAAQLAARQQQEARLRQRQAEALNALAKREIGREVAAQRTAAADEAAADSAGERNEAEDALLRATEARLRAQLGVERQLQEAGLDSDALAAVRLERRVQELADTFDTELGLLRQLGRDTQALEDAKEQAISDLREAHQRERLAKQQADELEAQKRIADRVQQLQEAQAQAGASNLQQIEQERLATLAELEGASAQQRAAVNAVYDAQRTQARRQLAREIEILTAGENAEVLRLEDELAAQLAQLDSSMGAERVALEKHYAELIAQARKRAADEALDAEEAVADEQLTLRERLQRHLLNELGVAIFEFRTLGDAGGSALRGLAAAGQVAGTTIALSLGRAAQAAAVLVEGLVAGARALGRMAQQAASAFSDLTGFSFDVLGITQGDLGADERSTLEAQLASGTLSPEEQADVEAQLAELPPTTQAAAAAAVQEMVDGSLAMVQALVDVLPTVVQELFDALPQVAQALADAIPGVVQALVAALPELVQAVVASVSTVVQALAEALPGLVQALVAQLPVVVQALADALVQLLPAVGRIVATLVQAIPTLVESLLLQIPTILQALVASLGTVIDALVVAIPQLVRVLIDQLPAVVEALAQAALQLVTMVVQALAEVVPTIVAMLPQLVDAVLQAVVLVVEQLVLQLPVIMEALLLMVAQLVTALVQAIPRVIATVVRAVPAIVSALVELIPALVQGVVAALPDLLEALVMMLPTLVAALVTELVPALIAALPELMEALAVELPVALYEAAVALAKGLGEAVTQALGRLVAFFKDVITEIVSLGAKKTDTFGDTPGAQRAGPGGMTARFAPGDFVIAAQDPVNALRQALDAAQGRLAGNLTSTRLRAGAASVPGGDAAAVAMLQAAEALRGAAGGTQGAQALRVVVQADGRVLDDALFRAGQRGAAPRLQSQLRRATVAAGVHVGFDRGSYTG